MIGVFDSGVGGLTIIEGLFKELPSYSVLYFADLARSPYGTKSKKAIEEFSCQITDFLIKQGAKIIIIACNTASAQADEVLRKKFNVPIFNVITPAVEEAIKTTNNKRIGIIGTNGTIQSRAYENAFKSLEENHYDVFSKACPLFVPLAEEDFINRPETKRIAKYYLKELNNKQIDTLILGCTHYPLLKEVIKKVMGKRTNLIDSLKVVASVKELISNNKQLESSLSKDKKHIYYVSDISNNFQKIAEKFLGRKINKPLLVDFNG